jgi:hypothetical protein
MKSVRLTSAISMAVFCLLALQVLLTAQELQKHSFANLINDTEEIEGFSETSTPNPLIATTVRLCPTHLSFGSIAMGNHSSAQTVTLTPSPVAVELGDLLGRNTQIGAQSPRSGFSVEGRA